MTECISDRVYNYLLMGKTKLGIPDKRDDDICMWELILETYKNLRVDGYFSNGRSPHVSASGLIYFCAVYSYCDYTMKDVALALGTTVVSVSKSFHRISDYLDGKTTIFEDKKK